MEQIQTGDECHHRAPTEPPQRAWHQFRESVDPRIAEHELKRRVELRVYEVQAEMEDQGYAEAEIEERTGALRKQLLDDAKAAAEADARRAAAPRCRAVPRRTAVGEWPFRQLCTSLARGNS